jgi:hypothetical protein
MVDDCNWEFTHGLNPKNPRAVANEKKRPEWLPDDGVTGRYGEGEYTMVSGTIDFWDWDDDG